MILKNQKYNFKFDLRAKYYLGDLRWTSNAGAKNHQADDVGIQNCKKVKFSTPDKYIPLTILRDSVRPLPQYPNRCYNVTTYIPLMFDLLIKKFLKLKKI